MCAKCNPATERSHFYWPLFTTLQEEDSDSGPRTLWSPLEYRNGSAQLKSACWAWINSARTTPEMVAKEIDVAMLAYNLVRAVTCRGGARKQA